MFETMVVTSGGNLEGKTMLVMNSAILLAQNEYKVIVIDFDPDMIVLNNITQIEDIPLTLNNFINGEVEIEDIVYGGISHVRVIPAGMRVRELRNKKSTKIKELFERLANEFDIFLFDVPGGLDEDMVVSMAACVSHLIVMEPKIVSVKNAFVTKMIGDKLSTELLGVVVNRYSEGMSEVDLNDIEVLFDAKVLTTIPEDPSVKKSLSYSRPVVATSPMGGASMSLKNGIEKIVNTLRNFDEREREKRSLIAMKRLMNTFVGSF